MYGAPPQGHLQGQTRDNSNTHFFHTKKEHIDMCFYIISVVYICHIISCLKGFVLFYHIPYLQYLYQHITKFISVFYNKIIRQTSYTFLNYT